jgi:hypothetical protein
MDYLDNMDRMDKTGQKDYLDFGNLNGMIIFAKC